MALKSEVTSDLTGALKLLQPKPEILWMTPHSLAEIFGNLRALSRATGRTGAAETFIAGCHKRLEAVAGRAKNISHRPRVFCVEWADPVYCAGHWVPEMVELAGGIDELARKGTDSVRIQWDDVLKWAPEVLIFSPCGFNLEKALEQVSFLQSQPGWAELPAVRSGRLYAVDANSYFARPGPRVVDGVELLAHLIHPELFDWNGPADAFRAIPTSNSSTSTTRIKICPECGQPFECKMGGCWCNDFPPLPLSTAPRHRLPVSGVSG